MGSELSKTTMISVIIPACNEEKYIGKTLGSIKKQNFQDYETITIPNGCTDKTKEKAKDKSDKLIELEEANVSKARNKGAELARGEILLFLDADTLLESKNALKKIEEEFDTDKYSVATITTEADTNLLRYKLLFHLKNLIHKTLYAGCSGVIIADSKSFEKVGGFKPEIELQEDRELIKRLKKIGKYKVINTKSKTSIRRYKEWGMLKCMTFWIKHKLIGAYKKSDYILDVKNGLK